MTSRQHPRLYVSVSIQLACRSFTLFNRTQHRASRSICGDRRKNHCKDHSWSEVRITHSIRNLLHPWDHNNTYFFFNNFRLNFLRFYYTYFPLKQSLIAFHNRYLRCKVITFSKDVLSLISRKQLTFLNKLDTVCWFIRHSMAHSASVRLNFSQSERFRCWTIRFCFKNELESSRNCIQELSLLCTITW